MDAEILAVHYGGQRQAIKGFHTSVVDLFGILDATLGLEGKIFAQMPALVIASDQMNCVPIQRLQSPKVKDDLDTEIASVHIIAEKQISRLIRWPAHFEQLDQVVELAVNVAADGDGGRHFEHVLLLGKDGRCFADDAHGDLFGDPSFTQEMTLEYIRSRLAASIEDLRNPQVVGRRRRKESTTRFVTSVTNFGGIFESKASFE